MEGFSRADRMIITLLGLLIAAMQTHWQFGIDVTNYHEMFKYILQNNELNGMTGALAVSAWGGIYTFITTRFNSTRR